MAKRSSEVVEMVGRRRLDFCCLQETRWRGESARTIEGGGKRYKFFWKGGNEDTAGIGVLVAERWVDSVVDVHRINDRIMVLKVAVGKRVLNVLSAYAPQAGRTEKEKEVFWLAMRNAVLAVKEEESLVLCGDMNGHVGRDTDGYSGVHGGHGFGVRNAEGESLLDFAVSMELVIANTFFKKSDSKLVTYESGGARTMIDFVLVKRDERSMVKNVEVINGEPCLTQHKLLICKMVLCERPERRKINLKPRVKIWKLRKTDVKEQFRTEVNDNLVEMFDDTVENSWKGMKDCWMNAADKVCGKTRGGQRKRRETWWWNDSVSEAVKKKKSLFIKAKKSGSVRDKMEYNLAKKDVKRKICSAKNEEGVKFGNTCEKELKRGKIFKMTKQIVRKNKDVVSSGFVRDGGGRIVTQEEEIRGVWKEYFDKLSNEEFEWERDSVKDSSVTCGPSECISEEEVRLAVAAMKCGKAAGPSGVVSEMLKASGDKGISCMTNLFNKVIAEGRIPEDWRKSWIVPIYKGKGDSLECGSYRGIKLLDHTMKVFERVIEKKLRRSVEIDEQQFGFQPGKGTTDAIFIVRQMQEKYLGMKKELWMAFVDLEKAFDRVPREVLWWALRYMGVCEWLVKVIMTMYEDVTTAVKVDGEISSEFAVRVGVHQGSVLSPLLFITVMEALSRKFKGGLPWELLYADDLVLLADSEEELLNKIRKWKDALEKKGLRVNVAKTKVMRCDNEADEIVKCGEFPCGVCGKGVRANSIQCLVCKSWIHKRCSKIKGKLKSNLDFKCAKCVKVVNEQRKIDSKRKLTLEDNVELDCVNEFCYLGDMIGSGGGARHAAVMRVKCAWGKFGELLDILAEKGVSLKVKGLLYRACVQSVMVYGSETWPTRVEDMQRLVKAERAMVRWMCGARLNDKLASSGLLERLGVVGVEEVVSRNRLRWFGHVERKQNDSWTKKCQVYVVPGKRGAGRPKKTWMECVQVDMKSRSLSRQDTQNRDVWRQGILGKRPTCASTEKRTIKR